MCSQTLTTVSLQVEQEQAEELKRQTRRQRALVEVPTLRHDARAGPSSAPSSHALREPVAARRQPPESASRPSEMAIVPAGDTARPAGTAACQALVLAKRQGQGGAQAGPWGGRWDNFSDFQPNPSCRPPIVWLHVYNVRMPQQNVVLPCMGKWFYLLTQHLISEHEPRRPS